MKQKPRIYYTETQKALMWERWKQGDSLQMIAQLFDRDHSSIQRILAESGGIRPAPRCRSRMALTLAEREEVSRAIVAGLSIRALARRLGRAPSTISRELKRNVGREAYRATQADQHAWDQARRPKPCKLTESRMLANTVAGKLQLQWSPEQIAGWLKQLFTRHEEYHVSHETLYPGSRRLKEGASGALAPYARHAPLTSSHPKDGQPRQNCRRRVDQRASSDGSGSSGARALGGGPAMRQPQQPDRHLGRAPDALCHADKSRRQKYRNGGQRIDRQCPQASPGTVQITDLGSWQRARRA